MKGLLLVSMSLIPFCCAHGDAPMSGEHLNGTRYERYIGPAEVPVSYLSEIESAATKYADASRDELLRGMLNQCRGKAWVCVGAEYVVLGTGEGTTRAQVGVRYHKGDLQCVIFQNQILLAFSVTESERNSEKMYYLSLPPKIEVTDTYSF